MKARSDKLKVAYNLISFNDTRAVGTFLFMRRLFDQMRECDLSMFHFILYVQRNINIDDFCFPKNCSYEIVYVPVLRNSVGRILFEQTIFYYYLKPAEILFSPSSISMPVFARSYNIQTIYDVVPFIFPQKYNSFRRWYIKVMTKLVARVCDHIITVSNNSKSDIIKYLNINQSKISVIYTFIPPSDNVIKESSDEIYLEVKDDNGDIIVTNKDYFLSVTALQPAKNVEGLLRAFKKFSRTHQNYCLYIVGNKGKLYKKLYILLKELELSEKVFFIGYVDDYNLSKLYEKCIGVVYFSFYEGFGIPPLEGFYHGKACVASNISSIPEVVGKAGILANPYNIDDMANAMEQFILQHSSLKENIQEQINMFNPKVQTEKFVKLLINQSL
jgi:glycosyltransferase involved in cell wall biosynthesis